MRSSALPRPLRVLLESWLWEGLYEGFLGFCLVWRLGERALEAGIAPGALPALLAGLYLGPWLLFSPLAGQLADRLEKSRLLLRIRRAGLGVWAFSAVALVTGAPALLAIGLAGLGLQAAFCGPLRLALLSERLEREHLVSGNAFFLAASSGAVLLGAIGAWQLALEPGFRGRGWLEALVALLFCVLACRAAGRTPALPEPPPGAPLGWNPVRAAWKALRLAAGRRVLHLSMLGVAWLCFFALAALGLLAPYTRQVLHAQDSTLGWQLVLLVGGLACGALLCQRFSYERLEVGLVPFGSVGMTWFAFDLFLAGRAFPTPEISAPLLGAGQLMGTLAGFRILVDLFLMAAFAGFFAIPLLTAVQQHSEAAWRSSALAASLLLNAIFSCGALGFLAAVEGWAPGTAFAILAALNGLVAAYIYTLTPEFFLRLLAWLLAHGVYRLEARGLEGIPREGPMLLACNHVSFADWLVIAATVKRPVRFVMWHAYARLPLLRYLMRDARVIPIGSARQAPELVERAFHEIAEALAQGDLVCIFPEGRITSDGSLSRFRPGIERMARESGAPVLPLALRGFWGSLLSRQPGRMRRRLSRPLRSKVELVAGRPIPADEVTAERVQAEVASLLSAEA